MSKTVDMDTIAEAVGKHRTTILRQAQRECWYCVEEVGRGGKQYLYPIATLPEAVHKKVVHLLAERELATIQDGDAAARMALVEKTIEEGARLPLDLRIALCEQELQASSPAVPAVTGTAISVSQLTDAQRRAAEARMGILGEINRLARATTVQTAIVELCRLAEIGKLSPQIAALIPIANARANEDRSLSERTLKRWRSQYREGGFAALAPRQREKDETPEWWEEGLLRHWRTPGKISLVDALRQFEKECKPLGLTPPSYHQADRFLKKLGTVERNRGRMGPRELKTLQSFVKRDDSALDPLSIVLMDGHQFDAEVAHPHHGGPFRPEITTLVDAKTRLALGFSAGLAESAHAVMDAIRDGVVRFGIPDALYTDNGSGYIAAVISDRVVGLLARLGIEHMKSRAYNSQARGRSERLHQTLWVTLAKTMPTYIGKPMDAEAKKEAHKITRLELKQRAARILMPWRMFIDACKAEIAAYNTRPHRSLPKIFDPVLGKQRHQSPAEAWTAAIEKGWTPRTIDPVVADDLFRPHREVVTRRGVITLFGNKYFDERLVEWGGEKLMAGYEPTDPTFIWVRTLEGRLICKAEVDGHKRHFIPVSRAEQLADQRAAGRERRLETHLQEVRLERLGPAIEHAPQVITAQQLEDAGRVIELLRPAEANIVQLPAGGRPPRFADDRHKVEWIADNPELATEADWLWLADHREALGKSFAIIYGGLAARLSQQQSTERRNAAG